jgi:hypothetical protein
VEAGWEDFLRAPDESGHAVQLYTRLDELAESVAAYLATGFACGDPAVVIATPEHHATFSRFLAATGWDADGLAETGLLTRLDADETLASVLDGDDVSESRFDAVVGGVIDRLADEFPGRRARAFGEMVDLLMARGEHDAAARLEARWNELAATRRFSLLCGYQLDVFDAAAQRALQSVCDSHTHVRPAYDVPCLHRAVYDALDEVLGASNARMVHDIVSDDADGKSAPICEQVLLWITERMPRHAVRVLSLARAKYELSALPAG